MHICFLCNEYPPGQHGGVGSFTQTLGRALATRGHQVTTLGVYPIPEKREEQDEGVRVIRLPHTRVHRMGFLLNGRTIRRALSALHREYPISVLEGPELSLAVIPRSFPATKVIRMNGGHHFFSVTLGQKPRPWRSWLERRSFSRADHLCAVSEFAGETTRELLRLGDCPITILPNPVDVDFFKPPSEHGEEPGLIVFFGTVCEKKGVRQLIQAMPQVLSQVPTARLWVVGRDWKDPQTGESFTRYLHSFIPADLEPRIEFKGSVEHSDLPDIFAKAQICAFPSHMETQGIVAVEGMAMSKPVVFSKFGPGPEVIEDGISGLLCDPHDPASIAEKLVRLLQDESLRIRLGQQARQRALQHFSINVLVEQNEEFYRGCCLSGSQK